MKNWNSATVNYLNARQGIISRKFLYFIGKNRTTGSLEEVGFCNLPYDVTITLISGQTGLPVSRTYIGAGSLLETDDIDYTVNLVIQTFRASLSQTNDAVNNAIRGYDTRNAKVEFHYGLFDLESRNLIDTPYPHFVGTLNKSPVKRAKIGSSGGVSIEAVSRTRELTITNPAVKSDAYQQYRFPGDRFRKYSDVAGLWEIAWGEDKSPLNKSSNGNGLPGILGRLRT